MRIRFCWLLLLAVVCLSCNSGKAPGKFEIGKKTFLLDDKPFVVKAAEIHYPRVPREYWEHRIEMCKALGISFGIFMKRQWETLIFRGIRMLLLFAV